VRWLSRRGDVLGSADFASDDNGTIAVPAPLAPTACSTPSGTVHRSARTQHPTRMHSSCTRRVEPSPQTPRALLAAYWRYWRYYAE